MKQRHQRSGMLALFEMREREKFTFLQLSKQSGIPTPTLSYWASKFRKEREADAAATPSLVPAHLTDSTGQGTTTLVVGCGIRIPLLIMDQGGPRLEAPDLRGTVF